MKVPKLHYTVVGAIAFAASAAVGSIAYEIVFVIICLVAFLKRSYVLPLLFLSGLLKVAPISHAFRIDITLLYVIIFSLYSLPFIFRPSALNKNRRFINVLILLMFVTVGASLLLTKATWYYTSKSGIFIVTLYLPLLLLIANRVDSEVQSEFISGFKTVVVILANAWVGVGFYNMIHQIQLTQFENAEAVVTHVSSYGENYMYFSSFLVYVFMHSFIELYFERRLVILNFFLLIVYTYLLLNSPARGLTIGLVFSLTVLVALSLKKLSVRQIINLSCLAAVVTVGVYFYLTSGSDLTAIKRLVSFDPGSKSIADRISAIVVAFDEWNSNVFYILFGMGTDSVAYLNGDPGLYAHNLVLELIFEYGLVGSIPLLVFFAISFVFAWHEVKRGFFQKNGNIIWLVGVYFILLSFSMFSNTLGNMRPLWIVIALLLTVNFNRQSQALAYETAH